VAGAVARQWSADSAAIQLEWGVIPTAAALSDSTPFSLSGKGGDGWLVALFAPVKKSPVAVRVRAGVLDSVAVAARPLASGTTLASGDFSREIRLRWGVPVAEAGPADGWVLRRSLAVGQELTPNTVMPPQVVRSGDEVRVEWQRGTVTVALEGVALASGALGETVSVRLAQRGGQRRGRVTGPGTVRLES
jgi:flagella basal body P-ring formation protein FlgA